MATKGAREHQGYAPYTCLHNPPLTLLQGRRKVLTRWAVVWLSAVSTEKEVMEKTARGRSREVRDLRRALQRFALDGTIHNALATAERLAREVSRAQELPSRNLPLTSPRPDVPEGERTDA